MPCLPPRFSRSFFPFTCYLILSLSCSNSINRNETLYFEGDVRPLFLTLLSAVSSHRLRERQALRKFTCHTAVDYQGWVTSQLDLNPRCDIRIVSATRHSAGQEQTVWMSNQRNLNYLTPTTALYKIFRLQVPTLIHHCHRFNREWRSF